MLLELVGALLMEFDEVLLVVKNFFKKLFPPCSSPKLLATTHLLLKAIKGTSFLLVVSENSGSFVEFTVNELSFEQIITVRLCHKFAICRLVCHEA